MRLAGRGSRKSYCVVAVTGTVVDPRQKMAVKINRDANTAIITNGHG